MAALDTNVLVRLLVEDDARQSASARRLVADRLSAGETLFVPVTVALELEWVLRSRYALDKAGMLRLFSRLLSTLELRFESEAALEWSLQQYEAMTTDFSDCLHAALALEAGEQPFWTFDKAAAKVSGARLLA